MLVNIFPLLVFDFGVFRFSIVNMVYNVGYLTTSLCIVPQVSIKLLCSMKAAQQVGRSCFLFYHYCPIITIIFFRCGVHKPCGYGRERGYVKCPFSKIVHKGGGAKSVQKTVHMVYE